MIVLPVLYVFGKVNTGVGVEHKNICRNFPIILIYVGNGKLFSATYKSELVVMLF